MRATHRIRLSDPGGGWTTSDFPAVVISLDVIAVICYTIVVLLWGWVFLAAAQAVA